MQKELKHIKRLLLSRAATLPKITSDLGYGSTQAIQLWLKNGRVPKIALERVRHYLKGK